MASKYFLKIFSRSAEETKKVGEILAEEILKTKNSFNVIALIGELGAGKTTFLKGFAKGLKVRKKIISPSFLIFREYPFFYKKKKYKFYHWDFYRVNQKKEILNLGFKEVVNNPQNIVAVEWANKIKNILPKKCLRIYFYHKSPKEREIKLIIEN